MENGPFSQEGAERLGKDFVAVRMLGGNDINEETRSFMEKYGVQGFPTMFAMNAEGDVLAGKSAYLPRDLKGLLGALDQAAKDDKEFWELRGKEDDASRARYARLLRERGKSDEAWAILEPLAAKGRSLVIDEAMALIHGDRGEHGQAVALYREMIDRYKDAEKRPDWMVRVAKSPLDGVPRQDVMAKLPEVATNFRTFADQAKAAGDKAAEPLMRVELGDVLGATGDGEGARKEYDLVIAGFGDTVHAPRAQFGRAVVAFRAKDWAGAKKELEELVKRWPESELRENAESGIQECEKRLAQ